MTHTKSSQPTTAELTAALAHLLTINTSERIGALASVVSWYEGYIPFVRTGFDPKEEKLFQRGLLCAIQGRGGATDGEREQGLRTAVKMYEKALASKGVPSIEAYYTKLDEERTRLEQAAAAVRAKYNDALEPLERCFRTLAIGFEIRKTDKPRQFDGDGHIIYSETYAAELIERCKVEGSMAMVLGEASAVIKAASVVKDALGKPSMDLNRMNTLLPNLFSCLTDHARIGAFRVNTTVSSTSTTTSTTKTPKVAPAPTPKPHVGTKASPNYRPGSLSAILLARLQAAPAGWIYFEDLFNGISSKAPRRLLQDLIRDGRTFGQWTITLTGRRSSERVHFTPVI